MGVYAGFEPDGNFICSISAREMEKVALGLNLPHVVFKGLNDYYIKGGEYEPADARKSSLFKRMRSEIRKRN